MKVQSPSFWLRAVAVWLLIAALETVHGIVRALWLVPALGEPAAQHLGFAVGSALVLAAAWATSGWLDAATRSAQWQAGALWRLLMLFGLQLMGLAPLLVARWRRG